MTFDDITSRFFVHHVDFENISYGQIYLTVIAVISIARVIFGLFDNGKPPFIGFRSWFEPDFLVRLRYSWGAQSMIQDGYNKYKDSLFRLARNDGDVLVIPYKYSEELRNLPEEKLSATKALLVNLVSKYSCIDVFAKSDLHSRVLRTKVTSNLSSMVEFMKEEFDYTADRALPEITEEWTEVVIYDILLQFVARISARTFVGLPLCRNDDWIETLIKYAEQANYTILILRAFPKIFHPFVSPLIPMYWNTRRWVKKGKSLLVPIIEARIKNQSENPTSPKPFDFLQWMIDGADERDGGPEELAERELVIGFASIHTTAMAAAHFLFDLCAHPEYMKPLHDEVTQALDEDSGWGKTTVSKLKKMDSFLKESQRLNPASLLGFQRVVQDTPITLSDGTVLAPGTHISIASHALSTDPTVLPDQAFNGLRYFNLLGTSESLDKRLQFAATDPTHLHFGHGRFACPGRFFVAQEMKMVLGELLRGFDVKFVEGKGRPVNWNADEFLLSDPGTKILMRRRGGAEAGGR